MCGRVSGRRPRYTRRVWDAAVIGLMYYRGRHVGVRCVWGVGRHDVDGYRGMAEIAMGEYYSSMFMFACCVRACVCVCACVCVRVRA